MKEIVEKLLEEVDSDIADVMLKEYVGPSSVSFPAWTRLADPIGSITAWQELRYNNRNMIKVNSYGR